MGDVTVPLNECLVYPTLNNLSNSSFPIIKNGWEEA